MANHEIEVGLTSGTGSVRAGEAQPPFVLALDIGTSSVRASFYDSTGAEIAGTLARVERGFCTTADGGAEVEPGQLIEEVGRVIDAALAAPGGVAERAAAVAITSFWHSLVGVGPDGHALTPVYGWADTRAAFEAEELRRLFDERATHMRTGCRFHASYWPAKLRWLRATRPEVVREDTRWMSFADLLALRLFGEAATSVSMASATGLLDQRRCEWDQEMLTGLNLKRSQLPLLADDEASFKLDRRHAARWPQLAGCAWFPALGDGATNNVGEGCVARERAALMIGTSGAMRVLYEGDAPETLPHALWCYRLDRRRVVTGGALSDGGGLYGWAAQTLALDDDEAIERALAAMEPDAHGLTVLPFWAGERSTGWHARTSGAVLGLTMNTRPVEIVRAMMEAVAYRFAVIAEALANLAPFSEVRASGGALQASATWSQIIADVLNRPIKLSRVQEASSRGAVLLALERMGTIKSVAAVSTPVDETREPDAGRHALYRKGLERQHKLYELLIDNQDIAALLAGNAHASEPDCQN